MSHEKWSDVVKDTIGSAQQSAKKASNVQMDATHVMLAMTQNTSSFGYRVLSKCAGGDISGLIKKLESEIVKLPKQHPPPAELSINHALSAVLTDCRLVMTERNDAVMGIDTLFLCCCRAPRIRDLLTSCKFDLENIESVVKTTRGKRKMEDTNDDADFEALEKYGTDFTGLAKSGKLDPVIGREDEVRRVTRVLARRTKNNPVLIGEPGVGKTAIVEGLAQRIVAKDVPKSLRDCKLICLDVGSLISGAKYRGEFEQRLKAVLCEIKESETGVVLFIDEMHLIMGAGKTDGSMDAANLLKPMLARGELRCIGATTLDEYRKYVEKDAAFERRFQPVHVHEPSVQATVSILRGLKERYAAHHGVQIMDGALVDAAVLSDRYITARFLPDKAIDLLDEACAGTRVQLDSQPECIDVLDRQRFQLEVEAKALGKEKDKRSIERLAVVKEEIGKVEQELKPLKEQYESEKGRIGEIVFLAQKVSELKDKIEYYRRLGETEKVAELQYDALPSAEHRLNEVRANQKEYEKTGAKSLLTDVVGSEQIAAVVSRWTGIPVHKLTQTERYRLLQLSQSLGEKVIGQAEAIEAITRCVLRSGAGLSKRHLPIGSFLFLGPTGVGKTELAKALACEMFDSEERLVRIDMSEYMEQHSVSRLIGAPPGYVGYDSGGQLTEEIRRHPYSVVLFDEVEKAHQSVFNVLLQILDDGRLTDGQAHTVDFSNTIIIMTSNLGAQYLTQAGEVLGRDLKDRKDTKDIKDIQEIKQKLHNMVMGEVKKYFRPEMLNRLEEIVIFNPLTTEALKEIVKLQIKDATQRLEEKRILLQITSDALGAILTEAYDPVYGARPIRRYVEKYVVAQLSELILKGEITDGCKCICDSSVLGKGANMLVITVENPEGVVIKRRMENQDMEDVDGDSLYSEDSLVNAHPSTDSYTKRSNVHHMQAGKRDFKI